MTERDEAAGGARAVEDGQQPDENRQQPDEDASTPTGSGVGTVCAPGDGGPTRVVHGPLAADPVPEIDRTTSSPDFSDPQWYLNRELSELSFQKRVLHEALDPRNPTLERTRFLALFSKNVDEFCMKRIGGLKQQMAGEVSDLTPDGRTPEAQWRLALETLRDLFERQDACYRELARESLPEVGVELVRYEDLPSGTRDALRAHFEAEILPTLTPLTFDPAHPFPFISNLSLSLAVRTRRKGEEPKFSRVKIPENQPRLLDVASAAAEGAGDPLDGPDEVDRFVFLEEVIAANLDLLFPNVEVLDWSTFRVTRNAEVRRNQEVAEGLIEMIEGVLRDRRFATVVRLEVSSDTPAEVRTLLREQLDLDEREVFERDPPLNLRHVSRLAELDRPDHSVPSWTPQPHPRFAGVADDETDRDVFDVIREDDVLVHHPYHSFEKTVQMFLGEAARNDDVLAIKAAIYRTSRDSQVIENLIEAARNGKQVAVMVELKARFDEENNLRWVERLEEEGIHVAYGTIGLKTHTKTALVVRREDDGVQLYSHIGTGNYHAETAKGYVDLGLMTNDADVGHDLTRLFNFFTGHSFHEEYRTLLVAPGTLRPGLVERIRTEADHARHGDGGRIVAKMNALEDPAVVTELYRAASAGVEIDLVVRDICRLRPGIEGVTDTVTVRSVVGRFLEHSRIFYFENAGDPEYLVGSADWMTRNLDRRVEAVTPIEDPEIRAELESILERYLADDRKAWLLRSDGSYVQRTPEPGEEPRSVQEELMRRAAADASEQAFRDRTVPAPARDESDADP
ncbi:polyphosphate kinase 1 [Halorubrum halodurans]|uniref:Polyphosphate kinase n=1 Tax=Halorubrum halodurans TaxID=1383851 RepID=A0A256IDK7_9EURY|nr:polyphosphate kinase 1 [Halorubrum halodurans]OYR54631.1 polyphosphate kinase 1 [Halorubrum halodurans]